jgi:hypothetical protein
MGGKSAAKKANAEADRARADEQARQERIRGGTKRIGDIFDTQFNDKFFDTQRQNYIDYAMPQLTDQANKAGRELLFSMDRAGQTEGSARAGLSAELEKRTGLQRQKIQDDALNTANQTRSAVESARGDLVSMLNVTGDAEGAANSALARSAALSQPTPFSPIGNLFADFTGALGTQAAAERARYYGGAGTPGAATYQTGLFAPRGGAVQVSN